MLSLEKMKYKIILYTTINITFRGLEMKQINSFEEFYYNDSNVSPEERELVELEVKIIRKVVEARNAAQMSQRDLAGVSGVKQPAIARIESMHSMPQIDTLLKVLYPLGYTLDIVPLYNRAK